MLVKSAFAAKNIRSFGFWKRRGGTVESYYVCFMDDKAEIYKDHIAKVHKLVEETGGDSCSVRVPSPYSFCCRDQGSKAASGP